MTNHNLRTHDDLESLLGVYALDALDPDEAEAVEAHLAVCPSCAAEMADHRNTASLLAATVSDEAPPNLWDRIAAELEQASDAPPPRDLFAGRPMAVPDTPQPDTPELEDRAAAPPAKVVPLAARRRRAAVPVISAIAAAAAAAAIVLGVNASHLNHRVNTLSHAVAAGGLQQAATAAALNPQHRTVELASATTGGPSAGQVVILPDGTAYWVRSNLPSLESAQTYQLWGLANGKAVSLGLLGANPQLAAFRVEPGVTRLMVTAEPKGGVPQPTTPVLVQGDIPA